ncbi:hypothetical protein SAM9427_35630 [Streptomyces sp. ETH9427]|nr:hypothetical protein SAM9427_35630 [Streptomyces sp. ETH9427]
MSLLGVSGRGPACRPRPGVRRRSPGRRGGWPAGRAARCVPGGPVVARAPGPPRTGRHRAVAGRARSAPGGRTWCEERDGWFAVGGSASSLAVCGATRVVLPRRGRVEDRSRTAAAPRGPSWAAVRRGVLRPGSLSLPGRSRGGLEPVPSGPAHAVRRSWAGTGYGRLSGTWVPPPLGDMYARLPCPGRLTGLRITGPKRRTRAAVAGPSGSDRAEGVEGNMGGLAGLAVLGSAASRTTGRETAAVGSMLDALEDEGHGGRAVVRDGSAVMGCAWPASAAPGDGTHTFVSADGKIVLLASGRVRNHRELAAALPGVRLRTQSDREILLHLYEAEGLAFLDAVRGTFALVVLDRRRDEVLFAQDGSGADVVYHAVADGRLVFASAPEALARCGLVDAGAGRATPAATIERVDLREGTTSSRRCRDGSAVGGADGRPQRGAVERPERPAVRQ